MTVPADAKMLRETAAMSEKLKALLVPHGASAEGWDDWATRLNALADTLPPPTTPAPPERERN